MVFHRSVVNWQGVHLTLVNVHSAICEMVNWKGEGVYLTWVYVHSALCETYIV